MAGPRILKDFNLFVDGIGFVGVVKEAQVPNLGTIGEDFRAGGMAGPVELDMGIEKMEAEVMFGSIEPEAYKAWGLAGKSTRITLLGALEDKQGAITQAKYEMVGRVPGIENDAVAPATVVGTKLKVRPTFYRVTIDGEELIEIDIENNVRRVGGVDQNAAIRQAIGQ